MLKVVCGDDVAGQPTIQITPIFYEAYTYFLCVWLPYTPMFGTIGDFSQRIVNSLTWCPKSVMNLKQLIKNYTIMKGGNTMIVNDKDGGS